VIIVDGASFRGRVDMGNAEPRAAGDRQGAQRPLLTRAIVRPQAQPPRPIGKPLARPQPPLVPARVAERPVKLESKPQPPPPPQPVVVAEGGKKKVVLVKKKK
jgi:hypothetical protein